MNHPRILKGQFKEYQERNAGKRLAVLREELRREVEREKRGKAVLGVIAFVLIAVFWAWFWWEATK